MSQGWVTPPTFSYGYPASMDDLNIIRNDLFYLYGEMYTVAHAIMESEVECITPQVSEKTAGVLWIVHKGDNLYYRIRAKSEASSHDVGVWIRCYDVDGTPMGTHEEEQTIGTSYSVFNNSGSAVDISGWGLTVDTIYKLTVSIDATTDPGADCWVETNYIYEEV